MSLTLLGLVAFGSVLWKAGDRFLSGLGTAAYIAAAVSWVVATGRALALREWTYDLEVVFIVAAGFSMLAFGAAVIRTRALPRWVGWLATGWSAGGLILFAMPHEGYPPLIPQLLPLLFGVALLRASERTDDDGTRRRRRITGRSSQARQASRHGGPSLLPDHGGPSSLP